jgi:hypothetical protein
VTRAVRSFAGACTPGFPVCVDRRKGRVYEVEKLSAHRVDPETGERFFRVVWAGNDKKGQPYEPTWEPESNICESLVVEYDVALQMVEKGTVEVSIINLYQHVRQGLAQRVLLAKTRCRPSIHIFDVECLAERCIAEAFLQCATLPFQMSVIARSGKTLPPSGIKVPIVETLDDDGVVTRQVNYTCMRDVADFCGFHSLFDSSRGRGALLYNLGRASNVDLMVVGLPVVLKYSTNRKTKGVVSFTITFPTVHINGLFGTPTIPQMVSGMLKDPEQLNAVVQYVKTYIPSDHPLYKKGWSDLPAYSYTLAPEIAVPSEPQAASSSADV